MTLKTDSTSTSIPFLRCDAVFVIAEIGVNHNGDIGVAKQLVSAACDAGADAVKIQTFDPQALVVQSAPKAAYQRMRTGEAETQRDMLHALCLSEDEHRQLAGLARGLGLHFLSSPFDVGSLRFLIDELDVPAIKVPSGEITNLPFLVEIGKTGRPVLLSTGMSSLAEVETALSALAFGATGREAPSKQRLQAAFASTEGQQYLLRSTAILHCTSQYPAPVEDANLRAMATMAAAFGLPVGFSDHTPGIELAIGAAALGAALLEKHITLDRSAAGPDHAASLEPEQFARMVQGIRAVEKALGDGVKRPAPSEQELRAIARRSLVASRPIRKGERFTSENVAAKRPGGGVEPGALWHLLGRASQTDYEIDDLIDHE